MIKICNQCGKEFECNTDRILCLSCIQRNSVPKKKATYLRKYGVDNPSKSPEIQAKMTQTFRKKYGVDRPIQLPEIKEKMKTTMKQRYDVEYYCQHPDYLSKSATRVSNAQKSFMKLLDEIHTEYTVEFPLESKNYDIYIKSTNIVVEVNPSYTHSCMPNHWSKGLTSTYHIEKTLLAEKNGIRCVHTWDWDDYDLIAKHVSNKKRIYARKCKIDYVDDIKDFTRENSIHDISLNEYYVTRLTHQGEILAILLFCKLQDNMYEMEYIPKIDTQVVGGLSKLWKHAINTYGRLPIVAHCDRSKFTGRSFQKILGLEFIAATAPKQMWSKERERKELQTPVKSTTEYMINNKWLPVYDCGSSIFSNEYDYKEDQILLESVDYIKILQDVITRKKSKTKYCDFCGKPFHPNSGVQRYCSKEHSRICPVCGKVYIETNNENLKNPPIACSYECRLKRAQETNLKRYGCKNYLSSKEHQEKFTHTCMEKYGVPYAMMSPEIRNKAQNSIRNKYGLDSFNTKKNICKDDIHTILYEDDIYIVFRSQYNYYIENIQLADYVKSMGKIPIITYDNEDANKVIGQLELNSNEVVSAKNLVPYRLTVDTTKEFLQENDYAKHVEGIVLSIGLVKDNIIYQVMVFGKNKHNKNYKLKLLRICNRCGYTITDGLDTLSTIASLEFGITKCIAYQDQSKPFMNSRLESIGMKFYKKNPEKQIEVDRQTTYSLGTNVYIFE